MTCFGTLLMSWVGGAVVCLSYVVPRITKYFRKILVLHASPSMTSEAIHIVRLSIFSTTICLKFGVVFLL